MSRSAHEDQLTGTPPACSICPLQQEAFELSVQSNVLDSRPGPTEVPLQHGVRVGGEHSPCQLGDSVCNDGDCDVVRPDMFGEWGN
jgi:hypothetical protein